jgi:hypothetical protein
VGGQRHAPAALPPGKTRYPLYRRLGGPQGRSRQVRKTLAPTGIRSPDRPARSESLYRLSYPGPHAYLHDDSIFRTCTIMSVCIRQLNITRFVTAGAIYVLWLPLALRQCTNVWCQAADHTENTKEIRFIRTPTNTCDNQTFQHIFWKRFLSSFPILFQSHKSNQISVIHVLALTNNSHNKTNKCTNVKIIFYLHTICHNSDMFRHVLVIFRELLNIDKTHIKTQMAY